MSGIRQVFECKIDDIEAFKRKAFALAAEAEHGLYLDNNQQVNAAAYHFFELLLAFDAVELISLRGPACLEQFRANMAQSRDWLFGYLAYDLKNELEQLHSSNPDGLAFPDLFFFRPRHVVSLTADAWLRIESLDNPEELYHRILKQEELDPDAELRQPLHIQQRITQQAYIDKVQQIRERIIEGEVYELNFCMEFFAEQAMVKPASLYQRLRQQSPTPFSAYLRLGEQYLLGASPERFLCKRGQKLISQPIKGTARRGRDAAEDKQLREELLASEKERAENVMIVDLVRNDLARSSPAGTVEVEELFGIYSFRQVHQMISTVSASLAEGLSGLDAICHAFPMGSMTGAPKIRAMQLIEHYEESRRGLYSGALGYFMPNGDFDFNVVIRSVLYNADRQYLSFQVGSAITFDSDPEAEYRECLLKASAIRQVLGSPQG